MYNFFFWFFLNNDTIETGGNWCQKYPANTLIKWLKLSLRQQTYASNLNLDDILTGKKTISKVIISERNLPKEYLLFMHEFKKHFTIYWLLFFWLKNKKLFSVTDNYFLHLMNNLLQFSLNIKLTCILCNFMWT